MNYKLSLNALLTADPTIFNNLKLPIVKTAEQLGIPESQRIPEEMIDLISFDPTKNNNRETLIYNICMQTLPFSVIYPTPAILKQAIGYWSGSRLPVWQRLFDTYLYQYNPIWNKDANIQTTYTKATTGTGTRTEASQEDGERSTHGKNQNSGFVKGYDKGDVSIPFDSDLSVGDDPIPTPQPTPEPEPDPEQPDENEDPNTPMYPEPDDPTGEDEPIVGDGDDDGDGGDDDGDGGDDTPTGSTNLDWTAANLTQGIANQKEIAVNNRNVSSTDNTQNQETYTETHIEQGNIGVTTTQQMIQAQRDIAVMDMIKIITDEFMTMFCVMVY